MILIRIKISYSVPARKLDTNALRLSFRRPVRRLIVILVWSVMDGTNALSRLNKLNRHLKEKPNGHAECG